MSGSLADLNGIWSGHGRGGCKQPRSSNTLELHHTPPNLNRPPGCYNPPQVPHKLQLAVVSRRQFDPPRGLQPLHHRLQVAALAVVGDVVQLWRVVGRGSGGWSRLLCLSNTAAGTKILHVDPTHHTPHTTHHTPHTHTPSRAPSCRKMRRPAAPPRCRAAAGRTARRGTRGTGTTARRQTGGGVGVWLGSVGWVRLVVGGRLRRFRNSSGCCVGVGEAAAAAAALVL